MDFEEEHADDEDNVEPEELEDDDTRTAKVSIEPDAKDYLKPHTFNTGTHKTRTNCSQQN